MSKVSFFLFHFLFLSSLFSSLTNFIYIFYSFISHFFPSLSNLSWPAHIVVLPFLPRHPSIVSSLSPWCHVSCLARGLALSLTRVVSLGATFGGARSCYRQAPHLIVEATRSHRGRGGFRRPWR